MGRESVGGDRGHAVFEPRGHHPPAHDALEADQHPDRQQPRRPARRQPPGGEETHEPQDEDEADHAAEEPVAPLPPVDELEVRECHALVHQLVLRALAVEVELRLPVCRAHRRDRPGHEVPLGDRQPRVGQPRQAADEDHCHHQHEDQPEPEPNPAAGVGPSPVDCPGRRGGALGGADLLEDAARLGRHPCPPCSGRGLVPGGGPFKTGPSAPRGKLAVSRRAGAPSGPSASGCRGASARPARSAASGSRGSAGRASCSRPCGRGRRSPPP